MDFESAAEILSGIPFMDPHHGRVIYDHVRETRPREILEIGTANGVSAGYMAAALQENGSGRITTLDSTRAAYQPGPVHVLDELGLREYVELVRCPDTSYTWYMKERVAAESDTAGNCIPVYDFVFIDGAHNWTIDGLAVYLAEKLLKPGGWLLLDDLDWTYAGSSTVDVPSNMSASELREPHIQAVYDLIVKQHPSFTQFRDHDRHWGWAKKDPDEPRRLVLETTESPSALVVRWLKEAVRLMRRGRRA